jgi:hypothetical protein
MNWRKGNEHYLVSDCGQYHITRSLATGAIFRYLAFHGRSQNGRMASLLDDKGRLAWDSADDAKRVCVRHAGLKGSV